MKMKPIFAVAFFITLFGISNEVFADHEEKGDDERVVRRTFPPSTEKADLFCIRKAFRTKGLCKGFSPSFIKLCRPLSFSKGQGALLKF